MQFVYKCSLLKIIIGNCNNSNPHRGPVLDPHSKQLSLPPLSLPVQPPTTSQRCTVNCSECAPICSAMSLWKSANSTIACSKLNSVYLPIIQVSAADFVSTLLMFILHQCTCTYRFVSTLLMFILHQCTCTYHFVTASSKFTVLLASCVFFYHHYKKIMHISKIWFSNVRNHLPFHPLLHTCTATPTPDSSLSINSGFCLMLQDIQNRFTAGVKNEWSCTSTPLYALMSCTGTALLHFLTFVIHIASFQSFYRCKIITFNFDFSSQFALLMLICMIAWQIEEW